MALVASARQEATDILSGQMKRSGYQSGMKIIYAVQIPGAIWRKVYHLSNVRVRERRRKTKNLACVSNSIEYNSSSFRDSRIEETLTLNCVARVKRNGANTSAREQKKMVRRTCPGDSHGMG